MNGYPADPAAAQHVPEGFDLTKGGSARKVWDYGSADFKNTQHTQRLEKKSERPSKINIVAVVVSMVIPVVYFGVVFALMSFHTRYAHPGMCTFFVTIAFLVVLVMVCFAFASWRRKQAGDIRVAEPSWLVFICISVAVAWTMGLLLGQWNYGSCMLPHYKTVTLNTYTNVNPASVLGAGVMDGGRFSFQPGTYVLKQYAIGFKKDRIYCAAPMTLVPLDQPGHLAVYDFWAVGIDCCDGTPGDFHCGAPGGKDGGGGDDSQLQVAGGSRVLDEEVIPWFLLASQQAESYYKIKANHPIFLTNSVDPLHEETDELERGVKFFMVSVLLFFGLQLSATILWLISFARKFHHPLSL